MAETTITAASLLPKQLRTRLGKHGVFWITGACIAIAVLVFGWLLFQPSGQTGSTGLLKIGQSAPNFTLNDSKGHPVTLAQLHGHPVVLNFWSVTCGPCQSETPLLQRTFVQYQSAKLVILGISQGDPVDSDVQFGQDYALTYSLLPDLDLRVNHRYGVTGLPASYFLDAQGIIRATANGALTTQTLATDLAAIGIK